MKFYLNWLKEYIKISEQPSEIADKLTLSGVEVGECKMMGGGIENVISAEILKIKKHPNADKLTVCQISNGREILSVVCGANNIKEKDKVPLAMVGAELPGGLKIKNSKIRGESSSGMLCSGKELKISDDASGIYILPKDTPLGRDISEYLNLKNWRFELEITPNRPDLLGMIGIARELGALTGRSINIPKLPADDGKKTEKISEVTVEINDEDLCPRYTAALIKDVKIKESPDWLKRRLEGAGIRSINNIVDITNFVMLEWGQPLHAFDLSKLKGNKIIIRRAKDGEKVKTIDEVGRALNHFDLAICDSEKPVAVAGIMGGFESEITSNTKDIFLESAYFEPTSIRKTSLKLGLSSDSSYRFERGVDPNGVRDALLRAVSLFEEISNGKAEKNIIDVYPKEIKGNKILLRSSKIEKVLGVAIPPSKTKGILEGLALTVKKYGDVDFEVTVPTFRRDLAEEVDLIEEIARIYGYHLIPSTLPDTLGEPAFASPLEKTIKEVENILVGAGFAEFKNYSFIDKEDNSLFTGLNPDLEGEVLKVQNPISSEMNVMRQNIFPSLLQNLAYHRARGIEDLKVFELDKTFHVFNRICQERINLVLAVTGNDFGDRWDHKGRKLDFYDVKGVFEEIAVKLNFGKYELHPKSQKKYMHPEISVDILSKDKVLGSMGLLHPDILAKYELPEVYALELNVEDFVAACKNEIEYRPYSKYPTVERDISIMVDKEIKNDDVLNSIRRVKSDLIKNIKVFDQYIGSQVSENRKSLSYRIVYQSFDRTLTEDEVEKLHEKILTNLSEDVKAELRK